MAESDDVLDDFHFAVMEKNKLKKQNADLVQALEKIERIAKDSNVRTKRTMLQMCGFLDEVILSIVEPALAEAKETAKNKE